MSHALRTASQLGTWVLGVQCGLAGRDGDPQHVEAALVAVVDLHQRLQAPGQVRQALWKQRVPQPAVLAQRVRLL